ncbi:MAG: 5'-nucleotidase C-terminal domain-containing protein [Turicibacter sp.]|nr:5'-nucleotidase C-terminal domain-containing protein [Turicibacter sp.]
MKKFTLVIASLALFVGGLPLHAVTLASDLDAEVPTVAAYSDDASDTDAAIADVSVLDENQTVLSVLHVNDVHGRFNVGIHYARLATIANAYRAQNPNTLVLDAGDAIHGTNFANLFRGESMINLMNLIGFDAMVAGNHEFNFGQNRLLELEAFADFPILGANIFNADGSNYLSPYTVIQLEDVTVGIFGLATPTTPTVTNPNNVIGLTFTDPVYVAQEMVDHLRPQVDVVIALTHLGLAGVRGSQDVANAVEGIDLIVEGHCHSVRPNGVLVNGTKIVTVGAHAANLGTVEIILEDGEVVSVVAGMYTTEDVADVEFHQPALTLMDYYMGELDVVLAEHVGYSAHFLNNNYVRRAETALGNLTGDLFLDVTGADVAMMNSGGIRDHLHPGEITIGDIFNIFPFGNVIEVHEVSGQVLLDALENSVSMFEINNPIQSHGRFPQIAGMSFTFDISQPAGSRISNLLIDGEPVDLAATYTMATSGFVGAGGDGFTMVPAYGTFIGEFGAIDEALTAFIRREGNINAQIEGRMLMRDADGYVRNPDVNETRLTTNNFVIHIDDLADMDVLSLSNAVFTINGEEVAADISYTLEIDGIGVYNVPLSITHDGALIGDDGYEVTILGHEITIFIVDDTVAWSDVYVIFSNNNEVSLPFAERAEVTAEALIVAADVEAYRVIDAAIVTDDLAVNADDLLSLQEATEVGTFDVRIGLNPEAVISVTLVDEVVGTEPTPAPTTPPGTPGNLPDTGAVVGLSLLVVGLGTCAVGVAVASAKKRQK